MFSSKRSSQSKDTISLAGWLFADLLLGLSMFFLVSNSVGTKAEPTVTPTMTSVPKASATQKATSTILPKVEFTPTPLSVTQGLEMVPFPCDFQVNTEAFLESDMPSEKIKTEIKKELDRCYGKDKNRIAGFVLTIGYHPDIVGTGYPIAFRVNQIIREVNPDMFGRVQFEAFGGYRKDRPNGWVWIRAYFVSGLKK